MRIFRKLSNIYWHYFSKPIDYARHLGVKIGKNCVINTKKFDTEAYLVTIGNNVALTADVAIHCHGGGRVARTQIPDFDCFGKVIVEDWAYIGTGSQIMPGVTIGEGALVAAGSIVTKSVAPHTVVGGNPARFICTVDEYIARNLKYNIGTKGKSAEEKREILLHLPEDRFIQK